MDSLTIFTKSKNSFEGQLTDEKTLKLVFRHWFSLVQTGLILVIFLVILMAISLAAPVFLTGISLRFVWLLILLGLLFWWYGIFFSLAMYYLNIWIITDHRLIESHQLGLFHRKYIEINLSKIQDISVNVDGFVPTMLGFGALEVKSAGTESLYQMANVPNPIELKEEIMKAFNSYTHSHPGGVEP